MDKVTIKRGGDDQWHWHRTAANNEIISEGEGYTRQQSAVVGAARANPDIRPDDFEVEDA